MKAEASNLLALARILDAEGRPECRDVLNLAEQLSRL
jgi:hypothetical protein